MYVSQHAFTPAPAKFHQWIPYNRNYMSLSARVPGAVLSRILRQVREPEKFLAVGVWTDRETAVQWTQSAESKLGAQPSIDLGLYDGYPMAWTRWELVDFAWGPAGPTPVVPGAMVRRITWDAEKAQKALQEALNRAMLSLLARQPGFICGETHLGHRGDRYQMYYAFRDAARWPFTEDEPPAEVGLLLGSETVRGLRARTAAPEILDTTVWEWVWGPEELRLRQ